MKIGAIISGGADRDIMSRATEREICPRRGGLPARKEISREEPQISPTSVVM